MNEIIGSFLAPLVTGAGAGALINYLLEKDRATKRRKKTLTALHAQMEALPRVVEHNRSAMMDTDRWKRHLVPMLFPVAPFEAALFTEAGISISDDTLRAATDYLLKAKELNATIEILQRDHLQRLQLQPAPKNLQTYLLEQMIGEMPDLIGPLRSCLDADQQ